MSAKSFLKILMLSINFENFNSINYQSDQSQSGVWAAVIGICPKFIEVNFFKLMGSKQNFQE